MIAIKYQYILIVVAAVIGICVASFFYHPLIARKKICLQIKAILQGLNELQKKTFLLYLRRDFSENYFANEKQFHELRAVVLIHLQKMQSLIGKSKRLSVWKNSYDQLEHLFEIIISLGLLRYRIKDPATFEVCEKELQSISVNMADALVSLSRGLSTEFSLSALDMAIVGFEEIYRSALQVVSKEPLIFLIFIQDLRAAYEELTILATEIEKI